MFPATDVTPDEILEFWFPDGPEPEPERHWELWRWRMRGGANDAIIAKYSEITDRATSGEFDHWAETSRGRLALIILLDQFPRSVWAGRARAFSIDPKALGVCLEGIKNGHYDALENVWFKTVFTLPLTHCECENHMANMNLAVELADKIAEEAPEYLKEGYQWAAGQPRRHRSVIERFGRHAHRNEVLRRESTPAEKEYIRKGDFPHVTEIDL